MTNKEFYLKVINDEAPRFKKAIEALPEDMQSHKVHEKSREAGNLAAQLAVQWKAIVGVLKTGAPDFNPHDMENQSKADMLSKFEEGIKSLEQAVAEISDQDWENGEASMGPTWTTKKYDMAWGFLFDAIHHRGQLTTYLRAMGTTVPAIYGPSADAQN